MEMVLIKTLTSERYNLRNVEYLKPNKKPIIRTENLLKKSKLLLSIASSKEGCNASIEVAKIALRWRFLVCKLFS